MEPSTSTPSRDELQQLRNELQEVAKKVEGLSDPRKKDLWDKLGSLTGVIVALVGGVFSLIYNSHQSTQDEAIKKNQAELQKIQLVGTFMPYLAGNDERARTVALVEVQDIINTKAAIALAVSVNNAKSLGGGVPSEGAVDFLHNVASSGSQSDRTDAAQALTEHLRERALGNQDLDGQEQLSG